MLVDIVNTARRVHMDTRDKYLAGECSVEELHHSAAAVIQAYKDEYGSAWIVQAGIPKGAEPGVFPAPEDNLSAVGCVAVLPTNNKVVDSFYKEPMTVRDRHGAICVGDGAMLYWS